MATQTIKAPKPEKAPKPDIDDGLAKALRTQQAVDMPYITSKSQLQTQITGAEGRAAKAKQEQDEMLATAEKTGTEQEAQAVRGAQEAYQGKLQAEPLPAFIPTKDSVQDIAGLFSLISVIGAVAGKGNAQMAMGNMNAMLEGYQKGRGDLYKKEAAEFDKNFKAMIKKHEEFRKEMEDAIKLAPYDKQQAVIDAKLAAVKAGSAIVNAQLDKGYLTDAYNTVNEIQKGIDKAKESYEKQKAKEAEIALKRQALYLRLGDGSKKTTAADMKREDKIREMTQGVRSIENLQSQLRDPDVRAGLQAKAAPLLEKLGSLGGAEFESAVNNALTGTDKTTLFLKDALLETYAIERAAKGGQRLTVQDMKMVGPVLDPTNYSADTYNALLDSRRRVLYNNLQDMGQTPEQIKEKAAQKPYEPYVGEQVPTVTTQEQFNALPPGAYYLEDGKRYQKPRSK